MKSLFIVRHAKAQQHSPLGDFKRELTERGEEDAGKAGKLVAKHAGSVDHIVTSDAARAVGTARIIADRLRYKSDLIKDHSVYEADVDTLFGIVQAFPDDAGTVVLVGHNPGLEGLLYRLASDKSSAIGLKTASIARVELNVDAWSSVSEGVGRVVAIYEP